MRQSYDTSSSDGYRPATLTLASKRPGLPASTPAPGLSGRQNPYSSGHEQKLKKSESVPNLVGKEANLSAARLTLERQCLKLPYDVRETVTSIISACFSSAGAAAKELEAVQGELFALRKDVKAKSIEIDILQKRCEKYKDRIAMNSEVIEQMVDEEKHNKEHQNKSVRSITRLAKTNRVLIGAFEALGRPEAPARPKSTASDGGYRRQRTTLDGKRLTGPMLPSLAQSESGNLVLSSPNTPITRQNSGNPNGDDFGDDDQYDTAVERKEDTSQNGKIRASLLRMARDYYKMVKNIDLLNTEVELLSNNLRYSEKRNRQMQLELEELKESASISSTGSLAGGQIATRPESPDGEKVKSKHGLGKTLENVDKRLADLVAKRAFDPLDGIKQMRLILMHMASAPSTLQQADVANHLVSRDVCKLFEVDAISCFVLQPGGEIMRRYTSRDVECTNIPLGGKSVAETVLRNGREVKVNSHKSRSKLDSVADGCPGVHTRKMLCIPLMDASNNRVVGCMQLINKYHNFKFSEVDDLFAAMFGDLAGSIMSSALLFSRVWDRSQVLTSILEASTSMFSAMPDAVSLTSAMPLDVDQVLMALEETARRCLSCSKVKAFVSSAAVGLEAGSMVALEDDKDDLQNKYLKRKHKTGAIYTIFPMMSGIAGMVMRTGKPYLMESQAKDQYHNPQADLCYHADLSNTPILSVPVVTLRGETVAVIQMIRGPKSPKLVAGPSSVLTGRILFEEAASWLAFQLSFSLQHVLAHVGRPCFQPTTIPAAFEPMQRINPASLALKPIVVGRKQSDRHLDYALEAEDDADDPTSSLRRASTLESVSSPKEIRSDSAALDSMQQRRLKPVSENDDEPSALSLPTEESSPAPDPAKEQVLLLQAEIKTLKKTIGRLSTVDLMSLKNQSNKKSPVPTISEDDDLGSTMGFFFSDDDLDGVNKAEENQRLQKDSVALREENEHLRNEIESLKELCATATNIAASNVQTVAPPNTAKLEAEIVAKVREDMKIENELVLKKELDENNAIYMARIKEQENLSAEQARENASMKDSLAEMSKRLIESDKQMDALRTSLTVLSAALESERLKAIDAESSVHELSDKLAQVEAPCERERESSRMALRAEEAEHAQPRASRDATRSPRGSVAPPAPSEDQVPISPRHGGWARFVDENNYPYYHNELTGETSWERPDDFPEHEDDYIHSHSTHHDADAQFFSDMAHQNVLSQEEVRVGNWVQGNDSETGMPYWRNEISGESVWELPADAHEGSVGQLLLEDANYINNSQASLHSIEHQGSVSSIDYGMASAGDYKIEL